MRLRPLLPAAATLLALAAPAPAGASNYAPGQVVVRYKASATHAARAAAQRATGTRSSIWLPGGARELAIENGASVAATVARLRAQPGVEYAHPNYLLHAAGTAAFYPNDPGRGGPGDWRALQWNFDGPYGVHVPQAWATMRALGKGGGRGAVVAVIDSGVAYRDMGKAKMAPDLYRGRFVDGKDFVDNDPFALDEDGHGTHVTGTIAEHVNNKRALTGIAYGVKVMPVRVLDSHGDGDGATLARGLRWAADHHADVINMSIAFDPDLRGRDIPEVIDALRYAHEKGAVMVASAGNEADKGVKHLDYPARDSNVISVGATTSFGCRAFYSNGGDGLDVMAPGGGDDADVSDSSWDSSHCDSNRGGRVVFQQTFKATRAPQKFILRGLEGTSESAPHVSAIAALVIASGELGAHPSPAAVQQRIEQTARDLGPSGYDKRYGYGLVDAAAAVAP
jgi:serine protease